MTLYVDIDGTLTDSSTRGGRPIEERVARVRREIERGRDVVLWSATGREYAERFARENGLTPLACLAKPDICVDDCQTVRKRGLTVVDPKTFFKT